MAADPGQPGTRIEGGHLRRQPFTVHDIVGIHPRNVPAAAVRETGVQRRHQTLVTPSHHDEAGITPGLCLGTGQRVVIGTVVDEHAFPAPFGLARQAPQAQRQGRRGIEGRQENGHQRRRGRLHQRKPSRAAR